MSALFQRHHVLSAPKVFRTETLWGDGFSDDRCLESYAVATWDSCSPDEYILLFPRLIPRDGAVPAVLQAHIEACVAVRAQRLAALDPKTRPPQLTSRRPAAKVGQDCPRDWFADGAVTRLMRRTGLWTVEPERLRVERALLVFLDRVLAQIQQGQCPVWSEASEILLAFGAAIHPAYVWPNAAIAHARGATAGWLGLLHRGRAALMPIVVAEYIAEMPDDGMGVDRQLVDMAGGFERLKDLKLTASRRLAGCNAPVRARPNPRSTLLASNIDVECALPAR